VYCNEIIDGMSESGTLLDDMKVQNKWKSMLVLSCGSGGDEGVAQGERGEKRL